MSPYVTNFQVQLADSVKLSKTSGQQYSGKSFAAAQVMFENTMVSSQNSPVASSAESANVQPLSDAQIKGPIKRVSFIVANKV